MTTSLTEFSATELVDAYRRKALSPVEVAQACLARIDALNPRFNAYCLRDAETTLAMANASEARWQKGVPCGLVDSVPISIKDLYLPKGWSTLHGSRSLDRYQPWLEDHPAVARLREQDAVFLGKTTAPEFGWKGVTDSPLCGVTRNPWNPAKTAGGSSGGAAVAAALGMGPSHIGSDGGGSIRIPASFCGIFGFMPTFARVPVYPSSTFGTISHIGPMTRTVADAALMLTVMSQPDPRAWLALPYDGIDYRVRLDDGIAGLKIAVSATLGYANVDPEIAAAVSRAVPIGLTTAGLQIVAGKHRDGLVLRAAQTLDSAVPFPRWRNNG